MSKAEELAEKAYPIGDTKLSDAAPSMCRNAFIEGYHQAEKANELTWEDIEKITDIWDDLHEDETVYIKTGCDTPEFYQEVLKRFKDLKK